MVSSSNVLHSVVILSVDIQEKHSYQDPMKCLAYNNINE